MHVVTSKDGTPIAYDRQGHGPALILVAGALCSRLGWSGPHLSNLLAPHFSVYNYDRRGRGDSGDTKPYAVAREVEMHPFGRQQLAVQFQIGIYRTKLFVKEVLTSAIG